MSKGWRASFSHPSLIHSQGARGLPMSEEPGPRDCPPGRPSVPAFLKHSAHTRAQRWVEMVKVPRFSAFISPCPRNPVRGRDSLIPRGSPRARRRPSLPFLLLDLDGVLIGHSPFHTCSRFLSAPSYPVQLLQTAMRSFSMNVVHSNHFLKNGPSRLGGSPLASCFTAGPTVGLQAWTDCTRSPERVSPPQCPSVG